MIVRMPKEHGLVNRLVPLDRLDAEVEKLAGRVLRKARGRIVPLLTS